MQLSCREQWLDPEPTDRRNTLAASAADTHPAPHEPSPHPISLDPFPVLSLLILPLLPSSSLTTSSHCIEVKDDDLTERLRLALRGVLRTLPRCP